MKVFTGPKMANMKILAGREKEKKFTTKVYAVTMTPFSCFLLVHKSKAHEFSIKHSLPEANTSFISWVLSHSVNGLFSQQFY